MTPVRQPANVAASVRARLLNLSRLRKAEFQLLLSEFAIERLLYRLGVSAYRDRFVLKGAILFKLWPEVLHRATWDLDTPRPRSEHNCRCRGGRPGTLRDRSPRRDRVRRIIRGWRGDSSIG